MKIGRLILKNRMILAPMAGISDYPFRIICRDYGCKLAYSEMVSSEGLVRGSEKTNNYLYKGKEETLNDNLIAFQIFGSDPDCMAKAADIVQDMGADIVDVNMGCPVKKVIKTGSGSALLANIPLLKKLVFSVRKRLKIPFTVKIRTGFQNEVNALEVAKILQDFGVDAVIIHGRTQKQGYKGFSDWELIKKIKNNINIPVIGNGDVTSVSDYHKRLKMSNCDGIMVGRGAMGKPWIFKSEIFKPSLEEIKKIILKHYRLALDFYGKEKGLFEMRKHITYYSKGFSEGNIFRMKINALKEYTEIFDVINNFF